MQTLKRKNKNNNLNLWQPLKCYKKTDLNFSKLKKAIKKIEFNDFKSFKMYGARPTLKSSLKNLILWKIQKDKEKRIYFF